jgi:hypothetical protein
MRRGVFTACPPHGDYILSPTGVSWAVRRATSNGSVMSISAGERNRQVALASLLALAEGDKADAWETVGTGSFWLIRRYRPSP